VTDMIEPTTPAHSQEEPEILGQHLGWDVYPMPVFVTLRAADVARSVTWFRDALGFGVMFVGPDSGDGPSMVHLRRSRYQDVLVVGGLREPSEHGGSLTVPFQAMTDGEVELIAERAAAHGEIEGPYDTALNTREVTVIDPDGHRFVFSGRRTDVPMLAFEDVMGPDR
jgi:catechol 2,3-dioxygenase-like lactoylglutathione lyase family enzyme